MLSGESSDAPDVSVLTFGEGAVSEEQPAAVKESAAISIARVIFLRGRCFYSHIPADLL